MQGGELILPGLCFASSVRFQPFHNLKRTLGTFRFDPDAISDSRRLAARLLPSLDSSSLHRPRRASVHDKAVDEGRPAHTGVRVRRQPYDHSPSPLCSPRLSLHLSPRYGRILLHASLIRRLGIVFLGDRLAWLLT